MTDDRLPQNASTLRPRGTIARRVGLGAALVAVPIGAWQLYRYVQDASEQKNRAFERSFSYDTAAFRQIDPALIGYAEITRIDPGLDSPKAIAVAPNGDILVGGGRMVRRLSSTGLPVAEISLSTAPTCLAADEEGRTYVALRDRVEVYAADGSLISSWKSFSAPSYITSIALSGDDVWVADAGRRVILRCSPDGTVQQELARRDPDRHIPGLVVPSPHLDVAVDEDGLIWVANPGMHRLEGYTADGSLSRFWGAAGSRIEEFFGCCNPSDFALLSDGSFITAEKSIARIKRYHPDGRLDCVVAGPDSFSDNNAGLDLAIGQDGHILVLERGAKVIRVFARAGGGVS